MSNLSAIEYVTSPSALTTGLFNQRYSVISANFAALNSDVTQVVGSGTTLSILTNLNTSGGAHFQFISVGSTPPSYVTTAAITVAVNSAYSDYLYFVDSSAQKSSYIIGSRAGGTADGLVLWDASAGTIIAAFSKQSTRFYSPVVGTSFDIGGSDFNIRAFSAVGDGVADDLGAFLSAIAALPTAGGVVSMPGGIYRVTDTINLSQASTGKTSITLRGAGIGATRIVSTVTNKPGIISADTLSSNVLEGFDLYQSGNALPAFRSGNYGIRNIGTGIPFLALRNLRIRYFGDVGIRLEGGNGPFSLQDVEVQSCTSYGIHLVNIGASAPEEVQIIGGNIHTCVGGLRLTKAVSTGVYDTDIELGTDGLYPPIQLDGGCVGGTFVDVTGSVQAVVTPPALISITDALGVCFVSGYYTTAAANVDGIRLDSTAARLNSFIGGTYHISGGGWYANVINGAKQNVFMASHRAADFAAGKGIVNNSTNTGDLVLFLPSSAVSDDRTLVIGGGSVVVGAGTALYPSLNFGGTSDISLGFYQSGTSHVGLSYGAMSFPDGATILPSMAFSSESSLGFYRSGVSTIGLSYGALAVPVGSAVTPSLTFSSETSLGFYRSAASIIQQSYGTLALSALSVGGVIKTRPAGGGIIIQEDGLGNVGASLRLQSSTAVPWWGIGMSGAAGSNATHLFFASFNQSSWANVLRMSVEGQLLTQAGSALLPPYAISSESSLGWYNSGASTMALSYGTIDLTGGGAVTSIASLKIKAGINNSCGTAVLGSNGSVNVANTYVKTGDLIFLTDQSPGGTLGDLELGGIRNSSGFTIQSTSITDTSTVGWLIIRPG